MPEVKTQPVKAQRFESLDDVRGVPGAFEFYKYQDRYPAGMIYCCPCGCERLGALHFRPGNVDGGASWEWDGNMDAPTLTPSVLHRDHWHGFLTAGVWVSC